MPKNCKIAYACQVMKQYGISEVETKAALKQLLKVYDNNWELIIDDGYRVLLEVILDKKPEKEGVKSKNIEAPSYDKTEVVELPTKRLYTRQQKKQAMSPSKSCLKPTPSKAAHQNEHDLFSDSDEPEESQPLLRKSIPRHQEEEALIRESKGVKSKNIEASPYDKTEVAELPAKRLCTRQQRKQAMSPSKSCLKTSPSRAAHQNDDDLFSDSDEPEESQPLLRKAFLRHQEEEALICESKGVKSKNKGTPSYHRTVVELPTKRVYTKQQKKQALSPSKSCLKTIPSRAANQNDDDLFSDSDEPEESQPLLRKAFLRCQEAEALISDSKGVKSKNKQAPSYPKTVVELPTKRVCTRQQKKHALSFSKSGLETTPSRRAHQSDDGMFSDSDEPEESQPLLRRTFRRHQEEEDLVSGNNLHPVHKCNPRMEDTLILISDDSSSDFGGSNVEEDSLELLEVEPLKVDYRGSVSDLSQSDVLSSPPKGEVKISLICNSSPQSDFHLPNLEVVEERCIKSYRNGECFLVTGTDSPVDENTRFRDVPDLKSSNAQDVLAKKDDCQGNNCGALSFPVESFVFQNLIKIVPNIPKPIASSGFKGLHRIFGFTVKDVENICAQHPKLCKVEAFESENHHSSLGVVKSCVYIDDITRGEEIVKISLEIGRNAEDLPTFFYIPRNMVYKNAYVNFSLSLISDDGCCSHCYGDCLASPIPCACAIGMGVEFAYTPGGLVKEKFLEECISVNQERKAHHYYNCKKCPLEGSKNKKSSVACNGHLLQKFIKECWSKCGCNKNCGNRIVQQGITVNLQVFLTPDGKGWGLRTLEDLPRGYFVCEFVGEIVTNTELYERNIWSAEKKHTYPMLLDADWGSEGFLKDEQALCLDATFYGNVARFINHRCFDPTLVEIPVEVETPDHHYYHVAFFTTRKVAAMEELTWDYGIDFDDHNHPVKAFQCVCGSPFCRDHNPRNH